MTFLWPENLYFLLFVPVFLVVYLFVLRRRRKSAAHFDTLGFDAHQPDRNRPGLRRHVPPALFLIALAILLVSLARPQMVVALPKLESTILLAFDVSGSMAAEDFKPNRIEVIKNYIGKFVEKQSPTTRIGVVSFSDDGFAVLQPTNQKEDVLKAVNRLKPQKGTSLGSGILAAIRTITTSAQEDPSLGAPSVDPSQVGGSPRPPEKFPSAMIILLSDGENNENPDPLAAAQTAADSEIRIHTVGIGNPAGVMLHINGFTIRTRLNEDLLKNISHITGGDYHRAGDEEELQKVIEDLEPQLVVKKENTEVTSLFSGASILIFLVGAVLSFLWFNRLP